MEVRQRFEFDFLEEALAKVPLRDHWDRVAARDLERSLEQAMFRLVESVLVDFNGNLDTFANRHRRPVAAYSDLNARLRATTPVNLHPIAVCVHALQELIGTSLSP